MFRITKATLSMKNGDKLILKEAVETNNVDDYREELHRQYECKSIILVYEQLPKIPVP